MAGESARMARWFRQMTSIRQISEIAPAPGGRGPARLPDWRNQGVILRLVLGVNLLGMVIALAQPGGLAAVLARFVELAAMFEPPLLLLVVLLAAVRDLLWRMSYRRAQGGVLLLTLLAASSQYALWYWLGLADGSLAAWGQSALCAALAAALLLAYFDLRARAHSPAIVEARLMALNARIRPHFLFNAINAVLSLIRAQPRQAEAALETVSDLFRAALRDPRECLPLSEEIALCRQYLELEKLRLGERLHVEWDIAEVPLDAILPPLMLQPLLENAVYHGVEPAAEGGVIRVAFSRRGDDLQIEIANAKPEPGASRQAAGNRMALDNIRERLALYYDLEARLDIAEDEHSYRIRIRLPCQIRNP